MAEDTVTIAGWKKAAKHTITLPSGVRVGIVIPDLPRMIETGQIPQHLLDAALKAAARDRVTPTKEMIVQQAEFTDKLVEVMLVEPKLTADDVSNVPVEDKEMLVEIGTRQRDLDAVGDHIGGLHTSEKFRTFRGLGPINPDVEDVSGL